MSAESSDVTGLTPQRGRPRAPLSVGMLAILRGCADKLDTALALRIGQMDSASRVDAVMREHRQIVEEVVRTLRSLA